MAVDSAGVCSVKLEGVWLMDRAADLKELLAQKLAQVTEQASLADRTEIDMAAMAELDACCCQLLAVFLENLKRRGFTVSCTVPQPLQDKIAWLGFSGTFAATAAPTKGCA